jgi:hypothetical protein
MSILWVYGNSEEWEAKGKQSQISKASAGQLKIITNDMDYAVVPTIQVFTSNREAIEAATGAELVRGALSG